MENLRSLMIKYEKLLSEGREILIEINEEINKLEQNQKPKEMTEKELNTHKSHCCVSHGCKYGDPDCPVVNKEIEQIYPCKDCKQKTT